MKQYYEKPSDKRVRKKKEMIANYKKKMKKLLATRGYQFYEFTLLFVLYILWSRQFISPRWRKKPDKILSALQIGDLWQFSLRDKRNCHFFYIRGVDIIKIVLI